MAESNQQNPADILANVPVYHRVWSVNFNTEAASAAHSQFAIPAEERTKQSRELTKRRAAESIVLLSGIAAMYLKPDVAWAVMAMVSGVIGVSESLSVVRSILDRNEKRPSTDIVKPG